MPSASATQVPLTTTQNKRRRGQKQTLQAFLKKPEPTFHDHWVPNWATCKCHRHDCNCPAYKGFSIHRIQLITLKCTVCHCGNHTQCPFHRLIHCLGPTKPLTG